MKAMRIIGFLFWAIALVAVSRAAGPAVTSLGSYSAGLKAPARVAADAAGNTYVTDPAAGTVVVFDVFGRRLETRTGFSRPLGIAVDAQNRIYVAEEGRGRVSVFDSQWTELGALGAGDGEFLLPNHIAINPAPSAYSVYVSDSKANEVKVYDGGSLVCRFGSAGTNLCQFDFPAGVCVSTGAEVFVVDQGNDRVQVFDLTGGCRRVFDFMEKTNVWGRKQGIVLDAAGRLYIANTLAAETYQGNVNAHDAATGAWLGGVGGVSGPSGLALDPWNRLFAASLNSGKVRLYGIDSFVHLSCEPAGSVVGVGTTLVFKATAGGPGTYAYQWMKDGTPVPGATNAVWILPSIGVGDSGGYSVVVAGPSGTSTSAVAAVAVQWPPEIFSQPQDQIALRSESVRLMVGATGTKVAYQWQRNGRDIEGATNSVLELNPVETTDAGAYTVLVRNNAGTAVSGSASVTVLVPPLTMQILSCGALQDQFWLTINTDPGYYYSFEVSTNLATWDALGPLPGNGIQDIGDTGATNLWQRYYRLRWTP